MRRFRVEGVKGLCEISEYGWPPMREPRRDSQQDGWQQKEKFLGTKAWVIFRHVGGPADGFTFGVRNGSKKIEPVGESL